MRMTARILGAALCVAGLASTEAAVAADRSAAYGSHGYARHDTAIARGYSGNLPSCADAHVHGYIASAFASREREYWGTGLSLSAFTRPVELGYRSWGPEFIPRRFCSASTVTNDGRRRAVYWLVAESLGTFSIGPGVDWCVTGLDYSYAYAPDCKMARP